MEVHSSGKMNTPKPYTDTGNIRTFHEDVLEEELIWHRDKQDREITVLNGSGWQLQYDNDYPVVMNVGETYIIEKMVYHRLIKGNDKLTIKINSMGRSNNG